MSTETTMILPSAAAGRSMGKFEAPAGADSQASFLPALLQQLQGLGGESAESVQGAVESGEPGAEKKEDLLAAIVAQLKVLSGGAEQDIAPGKKMAPDGKALPGLKLGQEKETLDDATLAGMAEWLAQFIAVQQTTQVTPAMPEDALEGGEAGNLPSVVVASLLSSASVESGVDVEPAAAEMAVPEEIVDTPMAALLRATLGRLDPGEKMTEQAPSAKFKPFDQAAADIGTLVGREPLPPDNLPTANNAGVPTGVELTVDAAPLAIEQQTVAAATPELSPATAGLTLPPPQMVSTPRTDVSPMLEKPIAHPAWSQDLGERVLWMVGQGRQTAELRLNPAHLGPLEVRINLSQDQASVQFLSHQASVREAVESALPKLKEMLGAQQLDLREVSVTPHSFSDQRDPRGAQFAFGQQQSGSGRSETAYPGQSLNDLAVGLVDEDVSAMRPRAGINKGLLSLYA